MFVCIPSVIIFARWLLYRFIKWWKKEFANRWGWAKGARLYTLVKPSIFPVEAFLSDLEGKIPPKLLTVLYSDLQANRIWPLIGNGRFRQILCSRRFSVLPVGFPVSIENQFSEGEDILSPFSTPILPSQFLPSTNQKVNGFLCNYRANVTWTFDVRN